MTVTAALYGQFRKPSGFLGRLAGTIMANRGSNRRRNAWTIGLLDLQPDDRFLEIGFGPGLSLALAAERITAGRIVGIDHSKSMRQAAIRRNAAAFRAGRIELVTGDIQVLDRRDGTFTKVMSANVVQFWDDGARAFERIASVMAPGGLVATTYQPRHRGATAADADALADSVRGWMEASGFGGIAVHRLPLKPVPAISVLGVKD